MSRIAIANARLVDPARGTENVGTLVMDGGVIVAAGPDVSTQGAATTDAGGQIIAPGIVDFGVFATDRDAFHFGGITRAALMPDGPPPLDNPGLIERAAKAGKPDLWIHPLAAATVALDGQHLAEIGLMQRAGARAVATGRAGIADTGVMARLLTYAHGLGQVTVVHSEDAALTRGAVATETEMALRLGLPSAPAAAEAISIARDLALVELTGARVHFRQVTTRSGFDLIRGAKARGLPVTCGITPGHLLLSDIALGDWRTFARLSPPLREESDRQAALAALSDGTLDVIASGHDPRGPEDKRLPFSDAAPGMAGADALLALSLGLVRDGLITLPRLFTLLSANPARLLGVDAGTLAPGSAADVILINPDTPWQIDAHTMAARAGNTPFDGVPVQGRVSGMWKGGNRVV